FVFGTIGWALVNLFVKSTSPNFFFIGGGCCIFLALYSLLILPDTPPEKVADKKFDALEAFGLRAFSLFRYWKFAVFMICVTMVGLFGSNFFFPNLSPYLNQVCNVPMADTARWGILNQVSELVFMTALAFCVGKFGLKWVLTLGLGAWGLRYFLLTLCTIQTTVMALLLHGIAYAFLYTAAYMYGDKVAPSNMKASVQGLIALLLLGVGQVTSGIISDDMHKNIDAKAAPAAAVSFFESTLYAQEEAAPADDADLVLPEATEQADPAEAAAPVEEVVSVGEAAPAEEVVSVEEAAPVEEVVSVEEVAPVEEAVLVEEFVSDDDVTPTENATVQEGGYSVEHWKEFFRFPAIFCFVWMLIFAVVGSEPVELGVAAKKDDASKAA
ncbi:MAG: MFS transporter, partial [Thermoguttaceae bacterium]|nr:MFS transporter [Thermoguttaceae bacterium]